MDHLLGLLPTVSFSSPTAPTRPFVRTKFVLSAATGIMQFPITAEWNPSPHPLPVQQMFVIILISMHLRLRQAPTRLPVRILPLDRSEVRILLRLRLI